MVQEINTKEKKTEEKTTKKKTTATVKTPKKLQDYKKSHKFGYGRYENISKHTFYLHTEAFRSIAMLCRRSGLPKYLWHRIESTFCNSYGLTKLPIGLFVSEEVVPDVSGLMVKDGMSELQEDYVNCLDEDLKEDEKKVVKLILKWEKIAKQLQKEYNTKAKVGEEYDNSGRKRVKEDFAKEAIEWK